MANLEVDFLLGAIDLEEVVGNDPFHRCGPFPADGLSSDEDASRRDGQREEEIGRHILVEDEEVSQMSIAGKVVDFPQLGMYARDHWAGFNQFQ